MDGSVTRQQTHHAIITANVLKRGAKTGCIYFLFARKGARPVRHMVIKRGGNDRQCGNVEVMCSILGFHDGGGRKSGGHRLDGGKGGSGGSHQTLILIRLEKLHYKRSSYTRNMFNRLHTHKKVLPL